MPTVATSPFSSTHSWSLVKRIGAGSLRLAGVAVRDEGKRNDLGGLGLAADDGGEACAGRGEGGRDKGEGDGMAQAGAEAAGGDAADHRPVGAGDLGALPSRSALDLQADAHPGGPLGLLTGDAPGARQVAALDPALGDREAQVRLY